MKCTRTIDRSTRRRPQLSSLIVGKRGLDNLRKLLTLDNLVVAKPVCDEQLVDKFLDLNSEVLKHETKNEQLKIRLSKWSQKVSAIEALEQAIHALKEESEHINEDNNDIRESIKDLNTIICHKKCINREHTVMRVLQKCLMDENSILKKEHKSLIKESNNLETDVLRHKIQSWLNGKIKQENQKLTAKVRELKREIIVRKTDYKYYRSNSKLNGSENKWSDRNSRLRAKLGDLEKQLVDYPDLTKEITILRKNSDVLRQRNYVLYKTIQEGRLTFMDREAMEKEKYSLERKITALMGQSKYLQKKLSTARIEAAKQKTLEDDLKFRLQYKEKLTRRIQEEQQELEQLSGLRKTKQVLNASACTQRLVTRILRFCSRRSGLSPTEPTASTSA